MSREPDRKPAPGGVASRVAAFPSAGTTGRDASSGLGGRRLTAVFAVPLLACGLQWLLWDFIRPYVWFLFFPATYFCAHLGGLRGGLLSTVTSAVLVWYVFIPLQFPSSPPGQASVFSTAMFVVMGSLFGLAHERLALARRQSAELAQRRAHQHEIERWARLYAALSQINQAIVRLKSHEDVAREVSRVTVEVGGFKLAWIGRFHPATGEIEPLGCAGAPRELVDAVRRSTPENAWRGGPCWTAVRDQRACVINDIADAPEARGLGAGMLAAGIHAVAVFPIRKQDAFWGVLGVFAAEPGVFQDRETALLEQAATDIGYALENLENEARRREAEESLRTSECRRALALDAAKAGTWQWDVITGRNIWSDELWRLYGLTPGCCEPSYEAWRQTVHPDVREAVERSLQDAVRREDEIQLEWRVAGSEAEGRWVLSRGRPLRDAAGRLTHYIGVVMEITERKRAEEISARNLDAMVRLQKLAMTFVRAGGQPDALAEVVDAAIAISGADFAALQLVDPGTGDLRIVAHRGLPSGWLENWSSVADDRGSNGPAADQVEQVIVEDVAASLVRQASPVLEMQLKAGVRAYQSTPLVGGSGRVLGRILTHGRKPGRPGPHALHLLGLLARQSADLIDHSRAREALRESEARLRLSVAAANIGLWDWDLNSNRMFYSAEWKRQIGYDVDGIPDRFEEWESRVHPEDLEPTLNDVRSYLAKPEGRHRTEFRFRHKDGSYRWIYTLADVSRDEAGKPVRMLGCHIDITDRKQAEEALRASERHFRQVTETLPQLVWTCGGDGQCDYLSPQWVNYTGIGEAEQLRDGWLRQVHPADREHVHRQWWATAATGGNLEVEFRIRRHDGVYRWFRTLAVSFRDEAGKVVRWFGTNTDIDDMKRAEEEIRGLNAELEQRVRQRTAQLEAVNRELETFSYSVSHDLRAPLRHVQGFVGMLERELGSGLSDRGRHFLRTIVDASRDMAALVDDLLSFSRMGRQSMQESTVRLDGLVREVQRILGPATVHRRIDWRVAALPTVMGDPAMLRLVLANLLDNAVKYTRSRDPAIIEIGSAGMEEGRVILFVRDNGVGFDPQYAQKLFGVFQRLHASSEFEGTGIGLANVRRILSRHGGRVWAESEPDRGASFYFTLRPAPSPISSHEREELPPSPDRQPDPARGGQRS